MGTAVRKLLQGTNGDFLRERNDLSELLKQWCGAKTLRGKQLVSSKHTGGWIQELSNFY